MQLLFFELFACLSRSRWCPPTLVDANSAFRFPDEPARLIRSASLESCFREFTGQGCNVKASKSKPLPLNQIDAAGHRHESGAEEDVPCPSLSREAGEEPAQVGDRVSSESTCSLVAASLGFRFLGRQHVYWAQRPEGLRFMLGSRVSL